MAGIILWSTRLLPERVDYQGRGGQRVLESFADVFRNPHARLLLIVFGIETFGAILFARFRFNEREHARVRAALDARAG